MTTVMTFNDTMKALQKLARMRDVVRKSLVSDEHKKQLLAQIDEQEATLTARSTATKK